MQPLGNQAPIHVKPWGKYLEIHVFIYKKPSNKKLRRYLDKSICALLENVEKLRQLYRNFSGLQRYLL